MAQRDYRDETVTVTVTYSDKSRIEYDVSQGNMEDYSVLEKLRNAATTIRLYRADGTEQMTI